jgi:hypothetical protein
VDNRFYVYAHLKQSDGKCFYIGKGTGQRFSRPEFRNKHWKNIVNKHGYKSIILVNNISEQKAFELEDSFIEQIGIENLANIVHEKGWGGHTNPSVSKAIKGRVSPMKGKNRTLETKKSISSKLQKPIMQYDLEGNFIKEWDSIKSVKDDLGLEICSNLKNRTKTCGKYIWKYKN